MRLFPSNACGLVAMMGLSLILTLVRAEPVHAAPVATQPHKQTPRTTSLPSGLPPDLARLLAQLGEDDYLVRDQAMTQLLANESLGDQDIDHLFAAATLEEQRVRLRQVAVHHLLRRLSEKARTPQDNGILGLAPAAQNARYGGIQRRAGVIVRWTYPGSPAFVYLRQGDLITGVDGQPIPDANSDQQITLRFIEMITTRKNGAAVAMHVQRDGSELEINLHLGSEQALSSIYQRAGASLKREFTPPVLKQVQARLAILDSLSAAPAPLTLTLSPASAGKSAANGQEEPLILPLPLPFFQWDE